MLGLVDNPSKHIYIHNLRPKAIGFIPARGPSVALFATVPG
jgi:hypothetical protein